MIRLRGVTWDHPRGFDPLAASTPVYAAEWGVEVEWVRRSLKDFGDASIETLARNADLLVLDHPHLGDGSATGALLPLDVVLGAPVLERLATESMGPSHASYALGGHQWALAVDAACQVASHRPDLLARDALPQTWEELRTLAADGIPVGCALCPTDVLCLFLSLCAQRDDAPSEDPPRWVGRPTALEVMDRLRWLVSVCAPEMLGWNPIQLYDAMAAGAAIAYCPLAFGYTNYARPGAARHAVRFADALGGMGLLGGAGIAVSASTRHPVEAAEYAAWVSGAAFQRGIYTAAGGQPGNRAAWEDPVADAVAGRFFSDTRATMSRAFRRPRWAGWPAFQEYLGLAVHAHLRGERTAGDVASHLEDRFEAAFAARVS